MIRKGTYVLFLRFYDDTVGIGALGTLRVPKGDYCYVGNAMNGLDQRLRIHLSKKKTKRWHIDYLTTKCDDMFAYESFENMIPECELARLLESIGSVPFIKGFGSDDRLTIYR